jgi:hypothetical protein
MNVRALPLFVFLGMCLGCARCEAAVKPSKKAPQTGVLAKAIAGPMKDVEEIVFAVRGAYDDPHWYANIGYYCDNELHKAYAGNGRPDVGKLCAVKIRSGEVRTLLDARGGSVRDPQVHYDGRKVLFSYRPAGTDFYHLYEIGMDGAGLRQITTGKFDDYEPAYLPDGEIVFVSTRCRAWVNCWMTQVGVLYRCDSKGANLRRISYNGEHDNTPWVLPDGRVLYTRWEYVDRSQVEFHHLWTMNPDGTDQAIFFGNTHPGTVMIDAKPIPGTDRIVASFSPGHGVNEHRGIATIVSPARGPDDRASAQTLYKPTLVKDPLAISADCFLAARGKQILVMDAAGNSQPVYAFAGDGEVHEPRPVMARPREALIPSRVDWKQPSGRFLLEDVYQSHNLAGVQRGAIKKLLVLEILPKQVNFSGGPDLVSWLGTFTLERVLGTVPVEEDGSACFEVPACRPVFFAALDEKDLSVQRMHSFTSLMPGETSGCVGCHESRVRTPDSWKRNSVAALRRPPSRIRSFDGLPDVLDFTRDIQPILDRHCVACHNEKKRDGRVLLTGDLGPHWSQSFFSLFAWRQVADGRNGLGNNPPRTVGSSASPLLAKLKEHYGVKVSAREWRTVWLWIESGAPYAGSYAALRNEHEQQIAHAALTGVFRESGEVLKRRCAGCHSTKVTEEQRRPLPFYTKAGWSRPGHAVAVGAFERVVFENDPLARFSENILLNFSRPEASSLVLGPLAKKSGGYESCGAVFRDRSDPDYQRLVAAVARNKSALDAVPRYATPDFKPNRQYVREMKRFDVLPPSFNREQNPIDVFQIDQAYWRSFWYRPSL